MYSVILLFNIYAICVHFRSRNNEGTVVVVVGGSDAGQRLR